MSNKARLYLTEAVHMRNKKKQTSKQTNKQASKQASKTSKQANKQATKQATKQTNKQANKKGPHKIVPTGLGTSRNSTRFSLESGFLDCFVGVIFVIFRRRAKGC